MEMELVLSIFPGIDLLGKGFEEEGFCVVRGPDIIFGGDVRAFHAPGGHFVGVIGGPPCQDFSSARRSAPTGQGLVMLREFLRIVKEACPHWFLLENVSRVPDVVCGGYTVQRFDLNANECGLQQSRLRHFQFGSREGLVCVPHRGSRMPAKSQRICLASEGGRRVRRDWGDFCALQGLPRDFALPGYSIAARYRAVGNGVPVPMARVVARAVRDAIQGWFGSLCACGCGRLLTGNQKAATAGCRKRLERVRVSGRRLASAV